MDKQLIQVIFEPWIKSHGGTSTFEKEVLNLGLLRVYTVESRKLTHDYNMEINFLPEGHRK